MWHYTLALQVCASKKERIIDRVFALGLYGMAREWRGYFSPIRPKGVLHRSICMYSTIVDAKAEVRRVKKSTSSTTSSSAGFWCPSTGPQTYFRHYHDAISTLETAQFVRRYRREIIGEWARKSCPLDHVSYRVPTRYQRYNALDIVYWYTILLHTRLYMQYASSSVLLTFDFTVIFADHWTFTFDRTRSLVTQSISCFYFDFIERNLLSACITKLRNRENRIWCVIYWFTSYRSFIVSVIVILVMELRE